MGTPEPRPEHHVPPPTTEDLPEIEGYDITRALGRGGMGIVYLAWERTLDRWVALKMLPPHLQDDPHALERFRREARQLARVEHPNVVQIHSFGEHEGRPYFSMAYVEGEPLSRTLLAAAIGDESPFASWFRRGATTPRKADVAACVVTRGICSALADIHALGVVHRDVKPANVLLDQRGRPVLVDFGVACDPTSTRLTGDAPQPGTLRFMAPEQYESSGNDVDTRTDIYAVGLLLFEMLTLRPAFSHEDIGPLIESIRAGDKPTPREVDRRIPKALDAIVTQATDVEPRRRFSNVTELADALKRAMETLADEAEITQLALGAELNHALAGGRRAERATASPRTRSGTTVRIAIATFLGGTIATAGWLASAGDPAQNDQAQQTVLPLDPGPATDERSSEGIPANDAPGPNATPPPTVDDPRPTLPGDRSADRPVRGPAAALPTVSTLVEDYLASAKRPTPLGEAARAWLDGRFADADRLMHQTHEPPGTLAKIVYWHLLREVGGPVERVRAQEMIDEKRHGRGGRRPRHPARPFKAAKKGLDAKRNGRL